MNKWKFTPVVLGVLLNRHLCCGIRLPLNKCPDYDTKLRGSSPEVLEYPFIAISSRFTLTRGGSVIYWPSTEPSIKRCTCINKRKNSGSRCALNNNIIRAQTVRVSWREDASVRTSLQNEGHKALSNPRLSNQAKMRKKCCYGRRRT